jgi:hypothetical protein
VGKVKNKSIAWISYTSIRLALVILVWLVLQLFTPVRGLLAMALALLASATFSIIFLGRQRDAMSESMFGFFRRLNERIDASAAKEDYLDDGPDTGSQAKPEPQDNAVDQQQIPGGLEDGDQGRPSGATAN